MARVKPLPGAHASFILIDRRFASPGAVIDGAGFHNMMAVGYSPRGVDALHLGLECMDAVYEGPDGRLPHEVA